MLNIRPACPEEGDAVCMFFHEVIDGLANARYSPGWERDIYPDNGMLAGFVMRKEMYIGEMDGKTACAVALNASAGDASAMEVHLLAVHPRFRGIGLGKALVGFIIETARKRGMERICLDVTDGNLPAESLYASMGFVCVKTRRDWFAEDDYMDFREMVRPVR